MTNLPKYLAVMAVVALAGTHDALAADTAYCQGYAAQAVGQYQIAVAKGIPNLAFPRWHGDSGGHYAWCIQPFVTVQDMDAEVAARNHIIEQYR